MTGLFIGMAIPVEVKQMFRVGLRSYPQFIEKKVPEENWHLALQQVTGAEKDLADLGSLLKPLPQSFLPTINITHIGRGLDTNQMWAFVHQTPLLTNLQAEVSERLTILGWDLGIDAGAARAENKPHINLARLYQSAEGMSIADSAVALTFSATQINIYQSAESKQMAKYQLLGAIDLAH